MSQIYIVSFFVILNFILFFFSKRIASIIKLTDKPDNVKKLHEKETPIIGGLIIFINLFVLFLIFIFYNDPTFFEIQYFNSSRYIISFFIFSFLIFILGIYDDKFNLSANIKLLAYSLIFLVVLKLDPNLEIQRINFSFTEKVFYLNEFSYFFTIFAFLIFLNAFNMFDGINLQACTYSIFLFLILIYNNFFTYISIIILISLINYFILNIKGKNFLGDGGTYLLSYIIGYLFIKSYNHEFLFYADEIFLLMLIPGLDLLRCATIRLLKGKHPFKGGREHIHFISVNKIGYFRTYILIQLMIILPYLASKFLFSNFVSIFVSCGLYLSFLIYLNKSKVQGA